MSAMASATLEQLMRQIENLPPAERAELRRRLDAPQAAEPEHLDERDRRLMEDGLLISVPPPHADWSRINDWQPVKIEGLPLSEQIIAERRQEGLRVVDPREAS